MTLILNDNYDCTILTMELRKKYKILRIYLNNRKKEENMAIDLDKEKLTQLRDEIDKMIELL